MARYVGQMLHYLLGALPTAPAGERVENAAAWAWWIERPTLQLLYLMKKTPTAQPLVRMALTHSRQRVGRRPGMTDRVKHERVEGVYARAGWQGASRIAPPRPT